MLQTKANVRISFPGHWLCGADHNAVLVDFLNDFVDDGNRILIQTAASQETAVDVSFLVFQVRGDQRSEAYILIRCPTSWLAPSMLN